PRRARLTSTPRHFRSVSTMPGWTNVFVRWRASVPRSATRRARDRHLHDPAGRVERGPLMDLRDGKEEAAFRATLRAWLEANVPAGLRGFRGWSDPAALALGRDWSKRLAEAGYAGLTWPKEDGGARGTLLGRRPTASEENEGLTYLIVDMKSPGVAVRPLRQITGESEFNEIFFTDVAVPKENLLGEVGGGWRVAMTTLSHERGTF